LTPSGESASDRCGTQQRCSARLQRDLQASPAFAGLRVVFPLALAPGAREEPRRTATGTPARYYAHYGPTDRFNPRAGCRHPGVTSFRDDYLLGGMSDFDRPDGDDFDACL
jgi:hypothetical protein